MPSASCHWPVQRHVLLLLPLLHLSLSPHLSPRFLVSTPILSCLSRPISRCVSLALALHLSACHSCHNSRPIYGTSCTRHPSLLVRISCHSSSPNKPFLLPSPSPSSSPSRSRSPPPAAEQVFYIWVARSRSGSSSFTASAPEFSHAPSGMCDTWMSRIPVL